VGGLEGMNNFDLYQFEGTTFYQLIPWDKDMTISTPGRGIFDGSVAGAAACPSCSAGLINVLAQRLFAMPAYQNFYLEQVTRAANLMGATGGWADNEIAREYGVIDASASDDPNKQCMENGATYTCGDADFQTAVTWIHTFLASRSAFVLSSIAAAGYQPPSGDPAISSVAIAGTGGTAQIVPGALVEVNGANLGPSGQATAVPLARILGGPLGTYVTIEGVRAPIFTASSGQIEVQAPWDLITSASVVVSVNGESNTVDMSVVTAAPAILAVTHADGSAVDAGFPAVAGETIVMYLTGLGAVSADQQAGAAAPSDPLVTTTPTPQISVNNVAIDSLFSGLTPGLIGVDQVNVTLPSPLPGTGSVTLNISAGGAPASAQIWLQ
jgi:uncharacterized protein (TIGR03437 family)